MDKWDKRFMALTEQVGSWASCHRRKVGAIIVREKRCAADIDPVTRCLNNGVLLGVRRIAQFCARAAFNLHFFT